MTLLHIFSQDCLIVGVGCVDPPSVDISKNVVVEEIESVFKGESVEYSCTSGTRFKHNTDVSVQSIECLANNVWKPSNPDFECAESEYTVSLMDAGKTISFEGSFAL